MSSDFVLRVGVGGRGVVDDRDAQRLGVLGRLLAQRLVRAPLRARDDPRLRRRRRGRTSSASSGPGPGSTNSTSRPSVAHPTNRVWTIPAARPSTPGRTIGVRLPSVPVSGPTSGSTSAAVHRLHRRPSALARTSTCVGCLRAAPATRRPTRPKSPAPSGSRRSTAMAHVRTCGFVAGRTIGSAVATTASGRTKAMRRSAVFSVGHSVHRPGRASRGQGSRYARWRDGSRDRARARRREDGEGHHRPPPDLGRGDHAAARPAFRRGRGPVGISRTVPRPRPGPNPR